MLLAAKNETDLDHYQVRLYPARYQYTTLAMLAVAFLAVTRARLAHNPAASKEDRSQAISSPSEIRRMLAALCLPPRSAHRAPHWSRWRHRHQKRSRY
jgi:hypothetical protein